MTKTVWERTPDARYREDTTFHRLVDMLEAHLHNLDFTPSELRDAAMLASLHFEMRRVRHVHSHTMSAETAKHCWARIEEIMKAIQEDERPFHTFD